MQFLCYLLKYARFVYPYSALGTESQLHDFILSYNNVLHVPLVDCGHKTIHCTSLHVATMGSHHPLHYTYTPPMKLRTLPLIHVTRSPLNLTCTRGPRLLTRVRLRRRPSLPWSPGPAVPRCLLPAARGPGTAAGQALRWWSAPGTPSWWPWPAFSLSVCHCVGARSCSLVSPSLVV